MLTGLILNRSQSIWWNYGASYFEVKGRYEHCMLKSGDTDTHASDIIRNLGRAFNCARHSRPLGRIYLRRRRHRGILFAAVQKDL